MQQDYLVDQTVDTIYFGGGTPSILDGPELEALIKAASDHFQIGPEPEITLEANPDDLTPAKLSLLKDLGINRLSIGIQSFEDSTLKYLNRLHDSNQALNCLHEARKIGFDNLSIDLIYGIPNQDSERWSNDLARAMIEQPEHISSYCLTIEDKTVFGVWQRRGMFRAASDEQSAEEYQLMKQTLADNGYEQYEISNFCQPGMLSRHNSNYWRQVPYLGVGPGAHSFNITSRQFNLASNGKYLAEMSKGRIPVQIETLSRAERVNEVILTGLRTRWGIDLDLLQDEFGYELLKENQPVVQKYQDAEMLIESSGSLILTAKGQLLADQIAADLFISD